MKRINIWELILEQLQRAIVEDKKCSKSKNQDVVESYVRPLTEEAVPKRIVTF